MKSSMFFWRGLLTLVLLALCCALPAPARALPAPLVTLDVPTDALVNEIFTFTATFDNVGSTNGFGPFIDLIMPFSGADNTPDGIDFVDASYEGVPITDVTVRTFPASGCVAHPFAVALGNAPLQVCGEPGDRLVVLRLPFGSFTPDQPPIELEINARLAANADPGVPLRIHARGGFQFGTDALNNPCCDPSFVAPADPNSRNYPSLPITPLVMRPEKLLVGDELETASGENFEREYRVVVDVAEGQTVTNLRVTDTLASNLAYVAGSLSAPGCTIISTPNSPTNQLIDVQCGSVVGAAGVSDEIVISFRVTVVQGALSQTSGNDLNINNTANISGTFVTPDPGSDANVQITGGAAAPVFAARSIAVQKSSVLTPAGDLDGNGQPTPGDILDNILIFQISDYFAFHDAIIRDIISDGQRHDGNAPTLTVTEHTLTYPTTPMDTANYTFTLNVPSIGQTSAEFRVAQELAFRNFIGADLLLLGGCVLPSGTPTAPNCSLFNQGATQGTLIYRTIIQGSYTPGSGSIISPGNPSVDEGDLLTNQARIGGTIRDNSNFALALDVEEDDADTDTRIGRGTLVKSVYAYNGSTAFTFPLDISPGDRLTFRLTYSMPASDVEDLVLTDFLPIPIFDATELLPVTQGITGAIPAAGDWAIGPSDTFNAQFGVAYPNPTISTTGANTVAFNFGDFNNTSNLASVIDILFTVTVQTEPFAGSLALTNMARAGESSTQNRPFSVSAVAGFNFLTPIIMTHKGIVSSDNPNAQLVPPPPSNVFNPPGDPIPFTPVINSNLLGSIPINSNVGFADPGDLFRFAIVIENIGNSEAFDITVRDILPAGFVIPPSGLNLTVQRGDATALTFTVLNAADPIPLFGAGIQITDPGGQGACQSGDPTSGQNIVVITYDLQVDPNLPIPSTLTNIAQVAGFAAAEGGDDLSNGNVAFSNRATISVGTAAVEGEAAGLAGTGLLNVTKLPATGEPPLWRIPLMVLLLVSSLAGIGVVGRRLRRSA